MHRQLHSSEPTSPLSCYTPLPSENSDELAEQRKFDPPTRRGIFVGYHIHSGGRWSHDYLVIDAGSYSSHPDKLHVHVHRIREIIPTLPPQFPVANGTVRHSEPVDEERRLASLWQFCRYPDRGHAHLG